MPEMIINQLNFYPDFDSIDSKFDFYQVTTSEKFIKFGATFLDSLNPDIIKAIAFETGKTFYILTRKESTSTGQLSNLVQNMEDGNTLSFSKFETKKLPLHILLQLFLNSIGASESQYFSFNNLTGKLFLYNKAWQSTDKEGKIWSLQVLEVKITKDMCLQLKAHLMSSILLKKEMEFKKRKFADYPQYTFANTNNTLRRVSKTELNQNDNFILKSVNDKKANIPFFDFSDYKKFAATKIGCLYAVMNIVKEKYSNYFNIDFEKSEITKTLKTTRTELEKYKDHVESVILENGINFIDVIESSTSGEYLHDIEEKIKELIPDIKTSFSKQLSKTKLNIRYIKDKSCYVSEEDPHQNDLSGFAVQHITNNYSKDSQAATYNILKELAIKNDLQQKKITIQDWTLYGFKSDWIFGIKEDQSFKFMKIHPDGTFVIEKAERDLFNQNEYDKYMELYESSTTEDKVLAIIKDSEGSINLIRDTNIYSLPDFESVGKILNEVAKTEKLSGDLLKEILPEYSNKFEGEKEYSKTDILKMFPSKTEKQNIVETIFKDTRIRLHSYLRNKESREEYFTGITDINYILKDEKSAFYCVGEVGNGMKNTLERACVVRKIEVLEGRNIFEELLPLMEVEFVRYGMLTVLPFPIKYLREDK